MNEADWPKRMVTRADCLWGCVEYLRNAAIYDAKLAQAEAKFEEIQASKADERLREDWREVLVWLRDHEQAPRDPSRSLAVPRIPSPS